ncbi:uncharacterized protein LOC144442659 [Glandiceps talaboti]
MASVVKNPNYAVICSFLERYGGLLKLPEFTFPELRDAIEDQKSVCQPLIELHVKLMRKINKTVNVDKWERTLLKISKNLSNVAYWELHELGYAEIKIDTKLDLLKFLCEAQFDDNLKFKNFINKESDVEKMRIQPLGRDKNGLVYWYQQDVEFNVRIYREEQDDADSSTWQMVVSDRHELASLISSLQNPEKKSDDTDSTSGSVMTDIKNIDDETSRDTVLSIPQDKAVQKDKLEMKIEKEDKSDTKSENVDMETGETKPPSNEEEKCIKVKEEKSVEDSKEVKMDKGSKDGEEKKDVSSDENKKDVSVDKEKGDSPVEEDKDIDTKEVKKDEEKKESVTDTDGKEKAKKDVELGKEKDIKVKMEPSEEGEKDNKDEKKIDAPSDKQIDTSKDKKDGTKDTKDSAEKQKSTEKLDDGSQEKKQVKKTEVKAQAPQEEDEDQKEDVNEGEDEEVEEERDKKTKGRKWKGRARRGRKKKRKGLRFTPKRSPRKPVLRKVTTYKEISEDDEEEEEEEEPHGEDDKPCCKCGHYDHPEWILLCDKCDAGYHTACLRPPLMMIPDGEWFCPSCEHVKLVSILQEHLFVLDGQIKRTERKKRRKERLTFVGINPENIIMNADKITTKISRKGRETYEEELMFERRSGRQRRQISYRFEEFDDAIYSAIKDEIKEKEEYEAEYQEIGVSRGKDMATIERAEREREAKQKKGKKRRLMDLDATSEESYSSEEFSFTDSEADFVIPEEEEEDITDSDESYCGNRPKRPKRVSKGKRRGRRYQKPTRRSQRNRGRKRYYSDSMDEEEEEEEDYESDHSSDYSDGILGRRNLGRKSRGRVRYQEKSDDSDDSSEMEDSEKSESEKTEELPQELRKSRVVKHRLVSESEDEDEEEQEKEEKSENSSIEKEDNEEEEEEEGEDGEPVAKRSKRYEDDSDFELDAQTGLKKRPKMRVSKRQVKRINYQDLVGNDSSNDSKDEEDVEEKEEIDDKIIPEKETEPKSDNTTGKVQCENGMTKTVSQSEGSETGESKPERTDTPSKQIATKDSMPPAASIAATAAVSTTVAAAATATGTAMTPAAAAPQVNGGNQHNNFYHNGNNANNQEDMDEDEDLLNVTDLVDYVTRDT